jgi:RNA polymerase sigma factor (sigma-70 family)
MDFRTLWSRATAGDPDAAWQLVGPQREFIAAVVRRRIWGDPAAVEDVVQQTLITALRQLASWRPRSATPPANLSDEDLWNLFRGWVCAIARNLACEAVRRRPLAMTQLPPDVVVNLESGVLEQVDQVGTKLNPASTVLEKLVQQKLSSAIMQCLPCLTPLQRAVLEKTHFAKLSDRQIAGQTAQTEGAIRGLRFRAHRAIRRCLLAISRTDPELAGLLQEMGLLTEPPGATTSQEE